jgi:phage gp45-like
MNKMISLKDFKRLIRPIVNKIFLLVSKGIVKKVDNSDKTQKIQAVFLNNENISNVERFQEYGIETFPLKDSESATVFLNGNRGLGITLCVQDRRYRPDYLEDGEITLYTYEDKENPFKIHMKNGQIFDIVGEETNITSRGKTNTNADETNITSINKTNTNADETNITSINTTNINSKINNIIANETNVLLGQENNIVGSTKVEVTTPYLKTTGFTTELNATTMTLTSPTTSINGGTISIDGTSTTVNGSITCNVTGASVSISGTSVSIAGGGTSIGLSGGGGASISGNLGVSGGTEAIFDVSNKILLGAASEAFLNKLVDERFKTLFNEHKHIGSGGHTTVPTTLMTDSHMTSVTKAR